MELLDDHEFQRKLNWVLIYPNRDPSKVID